MDKITFKGLKNVSAGSKSLNGARAFCRLVLQLNNDITPDLSNFREVLKKYPDTTLNKNYLRIDCYTPSEAKTSLDNFIEINGKEIEWNDNNLGLFKKLAKLTTQLMVSPFKNPIDEGYFSSEDFIKNFNVKDRTKVNAEVLSKPDQVQKAAIIINDTISKAMREYL